MRTKRTWWLLCLYRSLCDTSEVQGPSDTYIHLQPKPSQYNTSFFLFINERTKSGPNTHSHSYTHVRPVVAENACGASVVIVDGVHERRHPGVVDGVHPGPVLEEVLQDLPGASKGQEGSGMRTVSRSDLWVKHVSRDCCRLKTCLTNDISISLAEK